MKRFLLSTMAILSLALWVAILVACCRSYPYSFCLSHGTGMAGHPGYTPAQYVYLAADEIGLERSYDDYGITVVSVPTSVILSFVWFFPLLWAMPLGFRIVRRFNSPRRGRLCPSCFYECPTDADKCPDCGAQMPVPIQSPTH